MMKLVRYFNAKNEPEGFLYDLFRFQPLVILTEVEQFETNGLEAVFLREFQAGGERCNGLLGSLNRQLDDWDRRLAYCRDLRLTADLRSRPGLMGEGGGKEAVKKDYYGLLEVVRKLQGSYAVYLDDIERSGKNDPALAVLDMFLHNYCRVVSSFNARWKDFPDFYFERILHAGFKKPEADSVWVAFKRNPGVEDVEVPVGTGFVTGMNADNTPFCYRSREAVTVDRMEIGRVFSYYLERDEERFPAARVKGVTAILRNEMEVCNPEHPQVLFGGERSWHEPVGVLIESPMFLLREGCRKVAVSFRLTTESFHFFNGLVTEVAGAGDKAETVYKLLNDTFYLKISTEEGWEAIPDYELTYEEDGFLCLTFRLGDGFPPTSACCQVSHGWVTAMPALRVLMNRDAWLFPYSWAQQVKFYEMEIVAEVTGVTSVKLYNTGGGQDVSTPVFPFGVQPERGAWFVFGSYEMALKPLTEVGIDCVWQQLPDGPEGFYGYYRDYKAGIDNHSFQVRTEWLSAKKWLSDPDNKQFLFAPADGGALSRYGHLPECSRITCRVAKMPVVEANEEGYEYGRTRNGFVRVVLESPDVGFGHTVYRQVFTNTMMRNSLRKKHPLPLPAQPVSPMVDRWELRYSAKEKITFAVGQPESSTKIYHLCPLTPSGRVEASTAHPVPFARGFVDAGNLLLGFRNAEGYGRVRFLVDMAPMQREVDLRDVNSLTATDGGITWSAYNGKEWQKISVGAVLKDGTDCFMNSGVIEIALPFTVSAAQVDDAGLFWLCASFPKRLVSCPPIRGVYMNAVEVFSDTEGIGVQPASLGGLPEGVIAAPEKDIPGIAGVCQVTGGRGGRAAGNVKDLRLRMANRIAGRGRVVTPTDYERTTLERFPQVAKVKCLPGLDSKPYGRRGVVTLVVVPRPSGNACPLANNSLLLKVEEVLQGLAGAMVTVDAVNPVYEEMIVRCRVTLSSSAVRSEVVRRLEKKLNGCLAPWMEDDWIPLFGYCFSLRSLQNVVMNDPDVALLHGLSVLHVTETGKRLYRLDEYTTTEAGDVMIGASHPWCVVVPSPRHSIETEDGGVWNEHAGVGELEVGRTMVVGTDE